MKSSKIEKLSIILTVLGIFAIIIVSQLKRFFDLGFIPIIVYVVGGLLILGGLICYFKNYYKSKNYETKDIEPEKDYSEMMQEVSKDYDATSTSETIGSTDINSEKTQTPFDDFYEESDDERQNFDETEPTPEEILEELNTEDLNINTDIKKDLKLSTPWEKIGLCLLLFFTLGSIAILLLSMFFVRDSFIKEILIWYGFISFGATIIISIITVIIQRRIFISYLKIDKTKLFAECKLCEGKVLGSKLYSHSANSVAKGAYSNRHFYKVVVEKTSDSEEIDLTKKDVRIVRMIAVHSYAEGTMVKFYQRRDKPKKCYIVEDTDII